MDIIFALPVILLLFILVIKQLAKSKSRSKNIGIAHKKIEYLTTNNERKLFFSLKKALSDQYLIHCQTSLIALVDPVEFKYKPKAWSRRMDFVITDTATKTVAVIELDDASHNQSKRKFRDQYVNDALSEHHPLIRLPTEKFYKPEKIADILEQQAGIPNKFNSRYI